MTITESFDNTTEEVLKPSNISKKINGFPERVIVHLNSIALCTTPRTVECVHNF